MVNEMITSRGILIFTSYKKGDMSTVLPSKEISGCELNIPVNLVLLCRTYTALMDLRDYLVLMSKKKRLGVAL